MYHAVPQCEYNNKMFSDKSHAGTVGLSITALARTLKHYNTMP